MDKIKENERASLQNQNDVRDQMKALNTRVEQTLTAFDAKMGNLEIMVNSLNNTITQNHINSSTVTGNLTAQFSIMMTKFDELSKAITTTAPNKKAKTEDDLSGPI